NELAIGLADVAGGMAPAAAGSVCAKAATVLTDVILANPALLRDLAGGLTAVCGRMESDKAAEVLLDAMWGGRSDWVILADGLRIAALGFHPDDRQRGVFAAAIAVGDFG